MAERGRRNKVEGSFMSFSQVFKADCSRWSLQLRKQQWNALTSYRRSALVGLIGLSAPLNYEYMALDCVTFNIISSFIRIGDDLLRVILLQILHLIS